MQNKTKIDSFKSNLCKFSGFTSEQRQSWTVVDKAQDCINRLLDDSVMMENQNRYSLEERTEMTKTVLYRNLFLMALEPNEFEKELEQLKQLIG